MDSRHCILNKKDFPVNLTDTAKNAGFSRELCDQLQHRIRNLISMHESDSSYTSIEQLILRK